MDMLKAGTVLIGCVILMSSSAAWAVPKPSPVPMEWELGFKFQDIKRITVDIPGQGQQTYWYMIYTITNNTGKDVFYHPEISLVTNTLQVLKSQINVDPSVFRAIRKEYKTTYPWLEYPSKVIGKILQGKDNARDTVAIWPDFDKKASKFDVFVGGLSGEIMAVPNPMYKKNKKLPKNFVLQKTLQIHYSLPTDPLNRARTSPVRSGQPAIQWVMR